MDTSKSSQPTDNKQSQHATPGRPPGGGGSKMYALIGIIVVLVLIALGLAVSRGGEDVFEDIDDAVEFEDELEAMENGADDELAAPVVEEESAADEPASAEATVFEVTGRNFAFSQNEIRVNQGDTVRIEFSSTEGFHDWVVDEFSAATDRVNPGEPTFVEFVADQAGTFEYYCSVGQHRELGMVGNLIVE